MIIPSHYQIIVNITVIYRIPILKRVQIARFTYYYITTWWNHSEHTASRTTYSRKAVGIDSIFSTKLERRNKTSNPPNRLPSMICRTAANVDSIFSTKLRLRTYQTIISMICTSHWLPPYALRCFVVSGMQE